MKNWGGARLIAAGILLSRVFGLVRQKVVAYFLGDSVAADALTAAFRIPNFLQNLFGEGVLSASFIPVYSRLLAEGKREEAGRVAGAVFSLLALTTAVLVLGGIAATPLLVDLIAPGLEGEGRGLAVQLVRLIFPGVGMLVLGAWCLGVLNSHRRFFLSYVSPVLFNLTVIVALLVGGFGESGERVAWIAAAASVAGSALQFAIQVPLVLRLERGLRFSPSASSPLVRSVAARFGTVVVGRGVVQVSGFVDTAIASLIGAGSLATLGYSQAISMLPISLFGMSIAASELPAMAGEIGTTEEVATALRVRLDRGLGRIAYFVIPSAVALFALGGVIAAGLYLGGEFTSDSARWVQAALAGSAFGLLAGTMGRLYSSASYALGDASTPLRYAIVRVVLGGVLGWMLSRSLPAYLQVDQRWGITVLTMASGIAAWVEFQLLRRAITARIGPTGVAKKRLAALWGCAIAAGLAGAAVTKVVSLRYPVLVAVEVFVVFGAVYLGATRLLKVDDARRA